ncbi:MAG: thioredoxin-disulfide reductase [Candidatus Eremiobacteraeota bacterium]|nr:thioredoxin-disulfide reductase [Candidatus Eremiobacteraeota bacterium]
MYDVIIIGGGPAGLTAGLYASRAMLKTVLLEKGLTGGQMASTGVIDNYPGIRNISGMELGQKMEEHAKDFGLEIVLCEVKCLDKEGDIFKVNTDKGEFRSKTVIMTTGVRPRSLNVPGEKDLKGKGVSYCAICDGFFFRNKKVAVIGGGDSALEEGDYLTKFADKVCIIHRRDEFRGGQNYRERARKNPKIEFIMDTIATEIIGDEFVTALKLKNKKTGKEWVESFDGVFIYVGTLPNLFVCKIDYDSDKMGYIKTDDKMSTSIKGLFAAGDVRSKLLRQITTAVGDGATASVSAEKYIEELKYQNNLKKVG